MPHAFKVKITGFESAVPTLSVNADGREAPIQGLEIDCGCGAHSVALCSRTTCRSPRSRFRAIHDFLNPNQWWKWYQQRGRTEVEFFVDQSKSVGVRIWGNRERDTKGFQERISAELHKSSNVEFCFRSFKAKMQFQFPLVVANLSLEPVCVCPHVRATYKMSKGKTKMRAGAARRSYGRAGEKSGKIQDVYAIRQIVCRDVHGQTAALFSV
jgi:hypothetical protein